MTVPESKRAAPAATGNGSKKQMPQSSALGTYRDPASAASSPAGEALRAARANLAFARTMLDAIELLCEAHPDNEPLGAAFALIEPIETMLIEAVQAAECATQVAHPLGFDPERMRLVQSGDGWKVVALDGLRGSTCLSVHDGLFQGGSKGICIRLNGCTDGSSPIQARGQRSERIDKVSLSAKEPEADDLREMIAFLHHVLNEGGGA